MKKCEEKIAYVLSLDWYNDWEEFVSYKEIRDEKEPD